MKLRHVVRVVPPLVLALSVAPLRAQEPDSMVAPRLTNADEVSRTINEEYPPVLQLRRIGGLARMRLFISAEGASDTIRLASSTGLAGLDRAAWNLARKAEFTAASANGRPVGAWVDLNVRFGGREDAASGPVRISPPDRNAMPGNFQSFYPAELREGMIGTSVGLAVAVSRAGAVIDHGFAEPSCFETANEAAAAIVRSIAFHPDAAGPEIRYSFASVTFSADSVDLLLFGDAIPRDTTASTGVDPAESGVEMTAPRLSNRRSVRRALVSNYPPELRVRGVGGATTVHFRVEENGRVTYRVVAKSSGICALDVAALDVAKLMRFEPALRDGEPVVAWVELPIIFSAR